MANAPGALSTQQDTDDEDAEVAFDLDLHDVRFPEFDSDLAWDAVDAVDHFLQDDAADSGNGDYTEGQSILRSPGGFGFPSDVADASVQGSDPPDSPVTSTPIDDFFQHEDATYDDRNYLNVEGTSHFDVELEYEAELASADLPDFDPSLHRPPPLPSDSDDTLRRAREKAAAVVSVFATLSSCDREAALNYMTDFFNEFQHHATYEAIKRLAWEGLDVETLQMMIELREIWHDRAAWSEPLHSREWSSIRYPTSLPWKFAYQICRFRWQYPPDQMIDDDWFSEWRRTTATDRDATLHFATFVLNKVASLRPSLSSSDFYDDDKPAWKSAVNPLRLRRFRVD